METVPAGATTAASPPCDDGEPCLSIRARQAEVDSFRLHFVGLTDPADVLRMLTIHVREQFGVTEIALLWVPSDFRQVPEQVSWLPHAQLSAEGRVPAIPLRNGLGSRAEAGFPETAAACRGTAAARPSRR